MKLILVIKSGLDTAFELPAKGDVDTDPMSVAELEQIPDVEALLEKWFGYRFHINQMIELKRKEDPEDNG